MRTKYLLVSGILLIFLVLRFNFFYSQHQQYKNGQKVDIETRLTEEPQIKFGKQQFRIKTNFGERLTITTGLDPVLQYGDRIKVSGTISQREYKGHIFSILNTKSLQKDNIDHNFFSGSATYIRRHAKSFYEENLNPVSAGLLGGIIFGGNQGLPDQFTKQLRSSGVIHVIAASGMNVTFVATALFTILGLVFRRQIALTIATLGIIFYAFLSGFEPSIIRAAIMAIITFGAGLLGRQNLSFVSLLITGYIMLFFSPTLVQDVGFQLSFLATLGILMIKPLLDSGLGTCLPAGRDWGKLSSEVRSRSAGGMFGESLTTTLAAQATTIPIILGVFGSIGILSVLVNVLVLWTVPILMILGSVSLILAIVFEPFGKIVLWFAIPILFFFERTVVFFGSLDWNLAIPEVSPVVWIGYYLIIAAVIILLRMRNANKEHKKSPNRKIL